MDAHGQHLRELVEDGRPAGHMSTDHRTCGGAPYDQPESHVRARRHEYREQCSGNEARNRPPQELGIAEAVLDGLAASVDEIKVELHPPVVERMRMEAVLPVGRIAEISSLAYRQPRKVAGPAAGKGPPVDHAASARRADDSLLLRSELRVQPAEQLHEPRGGDRGDHNALTMAPAAKHNAAPKRSTVPSSSIPFCGSSGTGKTTRRYAGRAGDDACCKLFRDTFDPFDSCSVAASFAARLRDSTRHAGRDLLPSNADTRT